MRHFAKYFRRKSSQSPKGTATTWSINQATAKALPLDHSITKAPSLDDAIPTVDKVIPRPKTELLERDLTKAIRVIDRILGSSDNELANRKFLLDCFHEYGLPIMPADYWDPWRGYMNASGFGALQIPTEFVDFIRMLMKLNIKSGIEIGVYRGGSAYFTAAVLQRIRPDFHLVLVDPFDSLLGFEEFSRRLNLQKAMPSTSVDFVGKSFDYVFIDGDHTYEAAMQDYLHVGRYATKALGFHDIHDLTPGVGTVRAWNNIKLDLRDTHEIYEIAHGVPRGLGIGLAVRAGNATN